MRTALYKQAALFVNRGGDVERLEGGLGGELGVERQLFTAGKSWAGAGRRFFYNDVMINAFKKLLWKFKCRILA